MCLLPGIRPFTGVGERGGVWVGVASRWQSASEPLASRGHLSFFVNYSFVPLPAKSQSGSSGLIMSIQSPDDSVENTGDYLPSRPSANVYFANGIQPDGDSSASTNNGSAYDGEEDESKPLLSTNRWVVAIDRCGVVNGDFVGALIFLKGS